MGRAAMGRRVALAVFAGTVGWFPQAAVAQEPIQIPAVEAANHVGKVATVCGTVASARYADRTRGTPTFLNFEQPYPDQVFTVVIWGRHRSKFHSPPELEYAHRHLCVTGTVELFRGAPEMVIEDPRAIRLAHP